MAYNDIAQRACPICRGRSGYVLGKLTYALFDDLDMPGAKTMIGCDRCGMLYDDVAFTEDRLREYYRRNEHYAASFLGGSGSLSDDNRNRYDRIINHLPPNPEGIILDIGCGQGGFVAQCNKRGLRAAGIETSEKSRETGHAAGLDIYASMAEYAAKYPEAKISAVVISHVLEHLLNPLALLKEIKNIAPDGFVYIEVPDAASYLSPDAIRWHELYFEHLNHFCQASLSFLAAQSCIEVITSGTTPFSQNLFETQCLFIVGRFSRATEHPLSKPDIVPGLQLTLPSLPDKDLPEDGRPIALWGVSQYAMLLMGTLPQLARVDRLFDASPAKIGRSIRGVTVENAREIRTIPQNTKLILPRSPYTPQMLKEIEQAGTFAGRIYEI